MKKNVVCFCIILSVSLIFVASVFAEDLKFDYGGSFRLRQEIWDDVVTLGTSDKGAAADRNFLRWRTSIWGSVDYEQKFGAYLRFTNEMFWYGLGPFKPAENSTSQPGGASGFYAGELVFDNLYADGNSIFGLPVDLRIGRQDFLGPNVYGEGFLFMDGTPGDGSRTFYFNAFKARVRFAQSASLDLMYITDPKTDIYLPSLHEGTKVQLCGSNEQAFVGYGRIKIDTVQVEPYYVYKTEQPITPNQQLRLNTAGARVVASPAGGWNMGIEGAYQWGNYDSGSQFNDRRGYGGYVFVGRKYENVGLKPEWDLRYIYLSGDDPKTTTKNETWDPLFSRNPYWNELFIYTLIPETTRYGGPIPGYWTNLELVKASLKVNFSEATSFTGTLQYLWAPQKTAGLPSAMFTNNGHGRGYLPTALLSHRFTKNLDGFLQLEYFVPGDFYNSKDNATFFRWQLQYKI
ncbi:MAG TPA: alginate export family protein [Thermodesulfovibrionales bacterium]|nr:alginate export family protein [Thermodesulfovibrionales bacterium]